MNPPHQKPSRCDRTEAWAALHGHFEAHGRDFDLREAFARDPGRFDALAVSAPEVFADLSKNLQADPVIPARERCIGVGAQTNVYC